MPVSGEHYWQDDEGLWVENVGPWAIEKQDILTKYVQISGATRKKYTQCAFIDVFCGPGKSCIRSNGNLIDGSPVAAYRQAQKSHPFSAMYISDADAELLKSAATRLESLAAPVRAVEGPARSALPAIVNKLSRSGLHLALLDPHNLGALSFDLFESLARLRKVDIIVHVSLGDLQRNTGLYTSMEQTQFDDFAPDWRKHISTNMNKKALRAAIIKYWTEKVVGLGLPPAKHWELIRGEQRQRLYWLIMLAGHSLPHAFWNKITSAAKAPQFNF
jgi:three-Cys-motif partner protein